MTEVEQLRERVRELKLERDTLLIALTANLRFVRPKNGDVIIARCENADDIPTMRKLAEFLVERIGIDALILTMPLDKDLAQLDDEQMAEAGWRRTDV